MVRIPTIKIIDITQLPQYKRLLVRCIFHGQQDRSLEDICKFNKERVQYLERVIPLGFHMKVLFRNDDYVGMVEYAPPTASGLPIKGENIIVMNCIWVLRYAQGNKFGQMLFNDMLESVKGCSGIATLALENYWNEWMQKSVMERFGFKSISSRKLKHKKYKRNQCFTAHLMWLPIVKDAAKPIFDEKELLKGISFCHFHPIYWGKYGCAQKGFREIYQLC